MTRATGAVLAERRRGRALRHRSLSARRTAWASLLVVNGFSSNRTPASRRPSWITAFSVYPDINSTGSPASWPWPRDSARRRSFRPAAPCRPAAARPRSPRPAGGAPLRRRRRPACESRDDAGLDDQRAQRRVVLDHQQELAVPIGRLVVGPGAARGDDLSRLRGRNSLTVVPSASL